MSQAWVGHLFDATKLATVGQAPYNNLAFAVSLKADGLENEFGVPGRSLAAKPRWGKQDKMGCGQHGGLARFEQSPTLLIDGAGFTAGAVRNEPVHVIDLAPSIMRHLGRPADGMDGRPLQQAP
jgi:hypothetical protein